jgi:ubiquinone/menaquinone biosynthesis C-methylase UbiE
MNFYSDETYGERVAGVYDEFYPDYDPLAIDALADLAHDGKALELGIGTGRIALPLSARNVEVHGIDAATSMITRLRSKPGSDRITVTQGNFADVGVEGKRQTHLDLSPVATDCTDYLEKESV